MEFSHSIENQNDRYSDSYQQEQKGAGARNHNDTRALWVKWENIWQPGIQCSTDDCPSATLNEKPISEHKSYVIVYFPHSHNHCWVDSQLICPITEKPEPLAFGTHESGVALVEDLGTPRRYMMQTLAVHMFEISDQLHIEAVVENARDLNAWREFASKGGQCKNYSDLGRMLVKLHSMILEVYVNPTWMQNSFILWRQRCENAESAESTEMLTKELFDSVLWEDVAKLWDDPVLANVGSDWKILKEECIKCLWTPNPPAASTFDGESDKSAYSECTSNTKLEVCRKRPKLEIRRGEIRSSDVRAYGSQLEAQKEVHDTVVANQHVTSASQGFSFSNLEGLTNGSLLEDVATTWDKVGADSGYQILPYDRGIQETPIAEPKSSVKNHLTSSSGHKYRQCSAFIETKGRHCGRWAKDGDIYCCMHLNSHSPNNAHRTDQVVSLPKSPICQGMTLYGRRCTHRCKNGSSFCLKHLLQEPPEGDKTTSPSTLVASNRQLNLSVEGQLPDCNAPSEVVPCEEMSQNKSDMNLTSEIILKDTKFESGRSAERWSIDSGSLGTRQQFECQSQETVAEERSTFKSSSQNSGWSRCIGWCRNNSGQCSHRAKSGTSFCEKHLPTSVVDGGMTNKHVSSELLTQLRARASSEDDRKYICRASDLLHEFMNVCLLEGTAYRSNSKGRIMDWILREVSKDLKATDALLKIISGEKEKLRKHLGIEEAGEHNAAIVPWIPDTKVQCSISSSEDDERNRSSRENWIPELGMVVNSSSNNDQMLRCKLCGQEFPDSQSLGHHWIVIHKKEAQCFFRGYACRICNSPFTNKRGLERHVKTHHSESLLEQCVLISCIHCGGHFMNYEQLWQHVVSAHSEEFIRSVGILEQVTGSNHLVHVETEQGIKNGASVFGNSKQDVISNSASLHLAMTNNETESRDKGRANHNTVRRYTCRFCGLKFHLLPDLGRHHQAEHMVVTPNKSSLPKKGKELSKNWRANKVNSKLTQKVSSSIGVKHATIIAKKKCLEKFDVYSTLRMSGCSETPEPNEGNHNPVEFRSSAMAEMLLPQIQKTKCCPSDKEIMDVARVACCRFNLHSVLEEKYGTLPERLYIKAARLCSEANIRLEWHTEGFVCPKQCNVKENLKTSAMLTPLPDIRFHTLPTQLDNVSKDNNNGEQWGTAESHLVLTSPPLKKTFVICDDLSFGKEPTPIACVLDEDLMDLSTYDHFNEARDLKIENYMLNFVYITERLLDPSLGIDTKSSQLGCSCTQSRCSSESCDHVYLFDNDNDDAEDIYGQAMHGRFPYDDKGRIILEEGYLVYECNSMCSCGKECPNRVLQKGVQVKLEVYKTKQKGWAVRAAQVIARGTFICEYLGEVLNDQEANKRGERYDNEGCSYLYDIDAHIDTIDLADGVQPYVIDATKYGNVARFINHSCSPNLVNYQVLVESMDCQLAHIGLYASRDIAVGEELAYDYRYKLLPGKGYPCHCGARNCRGRLY